MTALTTSTSDYAWRPDVTAFAANEVVGDALLLQTSTVAGSIEGDTPQVRVAYVTDAAADYVDEAAEITESEPGLDEVLISTKKIAQLVKVSAEQFRQEQTASQLSQSVARALVKLSDADYITGTDPVGLANITGVVDGGYLGSDLDALVDLIAELETNGSMPSHIVLDPLSWATIRKWKTDTTDSAESLLGAGTTDAQPMLLGLPVIVNRFVGANTGVVLDRNAVVSAVGPVMISTSEHAAFSSDSVMVRATWRTGWNVTRPNWLGQFTTEQGT